MAPTPPTIILDLKNEPGYETEELTVEYGPTNGLRISILDNDEDGCGHWHHYHCSTPDVARQIAAALIVAADRDNADSSPVVDLTDKKG